MGGGTSKQGIAAMMKKPMEAGLQAVANMDRDRNRRVWAGIALLLLALLVGPVLIDHLTAWYDRPN
jgi:hypothetical protein